MNARTAANTALLAMTLFLLVFGAASRVNADQSQVTFTFPSQDSNYEGSESKYTLLYSLPSAIASGIPTNITFTLFVTELTGYKYQSTEQKLEIIFGTAAGKSLSFAADQNVRTFYQGSRWGPFNMSILIPNGFVSPSSGSGVNATVSARLVVYEQYNDPKFPFLVNDGQSLSLGSTTILPPGGSSRTPVPSKYLSAVLVGGMVVALLALSTWLYPRIRTRSR